MRTRGFTLIEIVVVVAIIGVLSAIVMTSLNVARAKARDTQRKQDIGQIRRALEAYFADYGRYPGENCLDSSIGWSGDCTNPGGTDWASTSPLYTSLVPAYIKRLPVDPINTWTGSYYYNYEPSGPGQGNCSNSYCEYTLQARLESGSWFCAGPNNLNIGGC